VEYVVKIAWNVNELRNIMMIKFEVGKFKQMLDVAKVACYQVVHRDHVKSFGDENQEIRRRR
jgi:hypothetical protein